MLRQLFLLIPGNGMHLFADYDNFHIITTFMEYVEIQHDLLYCYVKLISFTQRKSLNIYIKYPTTKI